MNNLTAYNSQKQKVILLIISILGLLLLFTTLFIFDNYKLLFINIIIIYSLITGYINYRYLSDKSLIAFEVKDNLIILYNHNKVVNICFDDIIQVKINDNYGSFDGCILTKSKRYPIHYLIKNQREVFNEFIKILESNNIKVVITSVNID